ncbi:MAG: primary-amine oxidase [Elusimicrobia bacterium]|nr:primary-amine oxidase [Elusimicrobiota bacterium]
MSATTLLFLAASAFAQAPVSPAQLPGLSTSYYTPPPAAVSAPVPGMTPLPEPPKPLFAAPALAGVASTLDPLNARELMRASSLLREDSRFPQGALFATLSLDEPTKSDYQDWAVYGSTPDRKAFGVLLQREQNATYEAVVNLTRGKVERLARKPGVQAGLLVEELTSAAAIVRRDPNWQAALRRRGINDFSAVLLDCWAPGTAGVTGADGPRLVRVLSFFKGKSSNLYARPVEGLVAVVDMASRSVTRLDDTGEVDLSQDDGAFDEQSVAQPALGPKPLQLAQAEGPTFEVHGWQVRWLNWTFRFALLPREGPVLYEVAYKDGAGTRKILHRASLSEMVVPYGDPSAAWSWRGAFDVGEYGVGRLASPLEAGTDVPDNAVAFDADFVDDYGKVLTLKRALALYERDGGLLWKHYTLDPEANESRRARELVLTSIAVIGNDDYGLNWVFHQDGTLEFEADLTGVLLAKGVLPPDETTVEDRYSVRLSTRLAAPLHQHFFNLRLDFDVDGPENRLYEETVTPAPYSPTNPTGNAFQARLRPIESEREARRNLDVGEQRRWLVASVASAKDGHPAGYEIAPGETSVPYADAGSAPRRRAGFLDYALWATQYNPEEMYAAGLYPNQAAGGDGLPRYSSGKSLDGKDLVVWYTFGITHIPRTEDWPIMSVHKAGVKLVPVGFFKQNPALGVPRPKSTSPKAQ